MLRDVRSDLSGSGKLTTLHIAKLLFVLEVEDSSGTTLLRHGSEKRSEKLYIRDDGADRHHRQVIRTPFTGLSILELIEKRQGTSIPGR